MSAFTRINYLVAHFSRLSVAYRSRVRVVHWTVAYSSRGPHQRRLILQNYRLAILCQKYVECRAQCLAPGCHHIQDNATDEYL